MQAVILTGGEGTRLRDLYPDLPKALAPVAGRPFMEWQIEWLKSNDVRDIHLALGHKADIIQEWLARQPVHNLNITTSAEPEALGTAGGLKFAEPFIQTNSFLVFNGDSLLPNMSFNSLCKKHYKAEVPVTIAVVQTLESGRFGTVEFNDEHQVTAFREKAECHEGWINGGVYAMNREVLDSIESGRKLSLETDIFPDLATRGLIRAYPCDPPLLDMGTPDGIKVMEEFLDTSTLQ